MATPGGAGELRVGPGNSRWGGAMGGAVRLQVKRGEGRLGPTAEARTERLSVLTAATSIHREHGSAHGLATLHRAVRFRKPVEPETLAHMGAEDALRDLLEQRLCAPHQLLACRDVMTQ